MKPESYANYSSRLADRIRTARKRARLSQVAVARQTGVTASAVSQWEHPSGTKPDVDRLVKLAEVTGVSLDWLIAGRGKAAFAGDAHTSELEVPAVSLDAYACNFLEERLLERFRALSPQIRKLMVDLMETIGSRRVQQS
jgi:transcriptional regulator with XRE-family HTH domain